MCTNCFIKNTPEFKTLQEMLKLTTVIMNSTDEGTVEKQFSEEFEYSLKKCKQPPCVLSFTFF